MSTTWYLSDDSRLDCPTRPSGYAHSPESLPDMRDAGRDQQLCMYCLEPVTTVMIDGVFRWVVHEYLIAEEPVPEDVP